MLHFLAVFVFFLCAPTFAFSAENGNTDPWTLIHDLNASGQYDAAYKTLLGSTLEKDSTYYYNLGTLSYRMGRAGAALGYFEKANHLKRHDPDIHHNLEVVRADLGHTLGENKLDPASTWVETFADQVSLEEVRGVLGLVALFLVLFWLRAYRKSRRLRDSLLQPAPLTTSIALALVTIVYLLETQANAHSPAIATERQTVRSGPGLSYNELSQLEAGTKVRLIGESDTGTSPDGSKTNNPWLQIRYTQDGVGWVPAQGLIRLSD